MKTPLLAACCLLVGSIAHADDWPQFRGPDRTGVSKEKGLLKVWPKAGPALAWTFKDAGLGFSSVAVVKGVVYTLGSDKDFKDEIVIALDEKTGKQLWTAPIGPVFTFKGNKWGDGPRSTPTIDGDRLYALGGQGDLVCVDITSKGKEVWRKNMFKDLQGVPMDGGGINWGYSESPLVDGDLLICTPGGNAGTLAALDKKTGAVRWRSKDFTEKAPYSSAVVADIQGVRQYIQTGYTGGKAGGSVAGIDAKTGNLLWKQSILAADSYLLAASPVVKGNQVYITSGGAGGCHLIDIDTKQKATDLYNFKKSKLVKNSHGGVVLIGDSIYGHTEPQAWICQDLKTGAENWRERNVLNCTSGAITAADGKLYLYTDDGTAGLVEADPKEFNLISSFPIPMKSKINPDRATSSQSGIWAHPVVANGRLYLRDQEYIFAFDIRGK